MGMRKKVIPDGPLKQDVMKARGPMDRRRAVLAYRENLAAASIQAKAWRHGGYLFGALLALCFGAALADIWVTVPGAGLISWASSATSFLATYMFGRASRLERRAVMGWPPCPA